MICFWMVYISLAKCARCGATQCTYYVKGKWEAMSASDFANQTRNACEFQSHSRCQNVVYAARIPHCSSHRTVARVDRPLTSTNFKRNRAVNIVSSVIRISNEDIMEITYECQLKKRSILFKGLGICIPRPDLPSQQHTKV